AGGWGWSACRCSRYALAHRRSASLGPPSRMHAVASGAGGATWGLTARRGFGVRWGDPSHAVRSSRQVDLPVPSQVIVEGAVLRQKASAMLVIQVTASAV